MATVGFFLAVFAALLHCFFFYLESVAFASSRSVQQVFLGREAASVPGTVKAATTLLFNQGCYNLFLAAGTAYGVVFEQRVLVQFTLVFYVAAGVALVLSAPRAWRGALAQMGPAALAWWLY